MNRAFAKEVLATLRKNGSDVTKPHCFEFYIYVPKQAYAAKAANKIRQSGFAVEISRSGKRWLVLASKTLIPATADLADQGRFFREVAQAVGGDFDGWESELMK
jgi:hypothetical protein